MNMLRGVAQNEPAATLTVLSWAAAAVCGLAGHAEFAPVLVAVGAAFLGLRTQVTPKGKANETAVQAARDAATTVAGKLTSATVGHAGEVTDSATGVINDAVSVVSGLLGGKPS